VEVTLPLILKFTTIAVSSVAVKVTVCLLFRLTNVPLSGEVIVTTGAIPSSGAGVAVGVGEIYIVGVGKRVGVAVTGVGADPPTDRK